MRRATAFISLISYAGCLGLSPVILAQFTLEMRVAAQHSVKKLSWGFKVIDVGTPGKVVSTACYDKRQVSVYLQPLSC